MAIIGRKKKKPDPYAPTPYVSNQQQAAAQPSGLPSRPFMGGRKKRTGLQTIGGALQTMGAAINDAQNGTNSLQNLIQGRQGQMAAMTQQSQSHAQQQWLDQMMQIATSGGPDAPQASAMLAAHYNGDEYGKALASNHGAYTLSAGQTRGFGDRAASHNQDYVGMGANTNDARRNDITSQNNEATQDIRRDELAEAKRKAEEQMRLDREQFEYQRQNPQGQMRRSLNPIYGTGADGRPLVGQLTSSGQLIPAQMPEGFSPLGPEGTSYASSVGRARGAHQGSLDAGQTKNRLRLQTIQQSAGDIRDKVKRAVEQTSRWNTGPVAGRLNPFATNLDATLKTIEADAAFSALQEMRDSSPTGGALGQITERELDLLGAAKEALMRSQGEGQLDANLENYMKIRERAFANVAAAYAQDYGMPFEPMETEQADPLGLR